MNPPSQGPKHPKREITAPETDPTTRNDVTKEAFDQTHQQGEEHTSKNQQITLTMLGYGGRFLVLSVVRDTANL